MPFKKYNTLPCVQVLKPNLLHKLEGSTNQIHAALIIPGQFNKPQKNLCVFLYFICNFTLLVCGDKNILPNLTNSQEPEGGFLAPWSWSR